MTDATMPSFWPHPLWELLRWDHAARGTRLQVQDVAGLPFSETADSDGLVIPCSASCWTDAAPRGCVPPGAVI